MRAVDFHKYQQSGENVCVEFKRGGNGAQKDTFESICAFLNRFGGKGMQGNLPVNLSVNPPVKPSVNPPDDKAGTSRDPDALCGPLSGLKSGPLSGLNATDSKLMEFIRSSPSMTIQELQGKLNLSRNGVRKALGRLKATGWLRRIGPDKGGHWEILER